MKPLNPWISVRLVLIIGLIVTTIIITSATLTQADMGAVSRTHTDTFSSWGAAITVPMSESMRTVSVRVQFGTPTAGTVFVDVLPSIGTIIHDYAMFAPITAGSVHTLTFHLISGDTYWINRTTVGISGFDHVVISSLNETFESQAHANETWEGQIHANDTWCPILNGECTGNYTGNFTGDFVESTGNFSGNFTGNFSILDVQGEVALTTSWDPWIPTLILGGVAVLFGFARFFFPMVAAIISLTAQLFDPPIFGIAGAVMIIGIAIILQIFASAFSTNRE